MNILYAASEAAPFAKSGGLGDVAGALPMELSKIKGNKVAVIMPFYRSIKSNPAYNFEYVTHFYVPLAWRSVYAGVFKYTVKNTGRGKNKREDLTYYFIDNEYYFDREGAIYGFADDGERFAFFSKAICEAITHIDFKPDVINCNDWQTGFVPLFLKAHYNDVDCLKNVKTVFTIHNIEYQGKADPLFLNEVLGVDESYRNVCTFDKLINSLKTAIVLADKVTTVSETYAHEIKYAYFAHGLESILEENQYKTCGIVNGIDTNLYNPETDSAIPANYKASDISGKAKCKEELQKELGLEVNPDIPVFAMVTRLVKHKGLELVEGVADKIMGMDAQFIVLGTGDKQYEDMFKFMEYCCPGKIRALITFNAGLASKIYAGADFFLMPSKSEPCGLSQLISMRYGTVPIVRETGGLVDTVPPLNTETLEGKGFTFKLFNAHDMFGAMERAKEFYFNKDKLKKHISALIRYDSSWKEAAQKYWYLYREIVE